MFETWVVDVLPWVNLASSCVVGYLAGHFYYQHRWCRACLGALLFVVTKLEKRGVYLSPYDRAVIRVAIIHVATTK